MTPDEARFLATRISDDTGARDLRELAQHLGVRVRYALCTPALVGGVAYVRARHEQDDLAHELAHAILRARGDDTEPRAALLGEALIARLARGS